MRTRYALLVVLLIFALFTSFTAIANPLIVDTLTEGDTATINAGDHTYSLTLSTVSDITKRAVFRLNGEFSKPLASRERYTFSDGSILAVGSVLPNEAGERNGRDTVEYYFVGSGVVVSDPYSSIYSYRSSSGPEYDLT